MPKGTLGAPKGMGLGGSFLKPGFAGAWDDGMIGEVKRRMQSLVYRQVDIKSEACVRPGLGFCSKTVKN